MFYLFGGLLIWEANSGMDWLYIADFKGKKIQTMNFGLYFWEGGGGSFNFRNPDYFFTSNQYIITKDFNSFGGAMLWVATPARKEKRRNCKNRNESAKKKIKIFIFSHFNFFI